MNVHFCVNRCPQLNCSPARTVDIDSIEDNELGANERISLLKEEESSIDISNNSTENPNNKITNRVDDRVDALMNNSRLNKLLNKHEENNRVRRDTPQRNHRPNKFDREDKKSKSTKNAGLPDAALQREIIVEGLSPNEHDYQARSLYTKGKF